jgi:hypothetical protein
MFHPTQTREQQSNSPVTGRAVGKAVPVKTSSVGARIDDAAPRKRPRREMARAPASATARPLPAPASTAAAAKPAARAALPAAAPAQTSWLDRAEAKDEPPAKRTRRGEAAAVAAEPVAPAAAGAPAPSRRATKATAPSAGAPAASRKRERSCGTPGCGLPAYHSGNCAPRAPESPAAAAKAPSVSPKGVSPSNASGRLFSNHGSLRESRAPRCSAVSQWG